ncbi:MAG: hypothetical protein WC329_01755 [Candidatus Omnitrophota bacterium]
MARRLLLDEQPLFLLPSLAVALGTNEALILQQFNYWLQASKNIHEGHIWTYNSYKKWQVQFPFMSKETVARAIRKLEKTGLIISIVGPNKESFDRTKWYRIDFDKFDKMFPDEDVKQEPRTLQNDTVEMPECSEEGIKLEPSVEANHDNKMTSTIPDKSSSETSSETSSKKPRAKLSSRPIFAEIQKFMGFPDKTDKDPIPNYGKEAKAIDTMLKRNYTEAEILDFWKKKVMARGGDYVSMVWVNEDIGKQTGRPRQATFLPDEASLAAAAKERGIAVDE